MLSHPAHHCKALIFSNRLHSCTAVHALAHYLYWHFKGPAAQPQPPCMLFNVQHFHLSTEWCCCNTCLLNNQISTCVAQPHGILCGAQPNHHLCGSTKRNAFVVHNQIGLLGSSDCNQRASSKSMLLLYLLCAECAADVLKRARNDNCAAAGPTVHVCKHSMLT